MSCQYCHKMICRCRPFKRGHQIPGSFATAFGVHHRLDGLIYTAVTRELANDHINDCLSDPELAEYGKDMWLVEIKYSLPMQLWGENNEQS